MASYRVVCEVLKGEVVFYQFDGCRNGRLYYGAEDYCTEKCGIWVIDLKKIEKIIDDYYSEKSTLVSVERFNKYTQWREELVKFKVEGVA